MDTPKKRIDLILVQKKLASTRQKARALVMTGKVLVNDQPVEKPGTLVAATDRISVRGEEIPFVSRGGLKLKAALEAFQVNPSALVCLDVGASTGGFTDCLLQNGAKLVYAIDVGYGQIAWKLRKDKRVVVIERTNIRHMPAETLGCLVDLVTIDVSFISLRIVVPEVIKFMKSDASIIALIKPQFEVGKEQVGKGGVVRDSRLHKSVIDELTQFFVRIGFEVKAVMESPLTGPKGNKEFFMLLRKNEN
ncbi:MAG: TlyA family RNA methyltransferase [Deltaproteobacteria bacterium]|nr:TlyA family RNA methyltransferase [Deltaproteobacteria bacterium]MBW1992941.1 TlyA family RNA methyltransferase [Deltaproteobacteria bacterium]